MKKTILILLTIAGTITLNAQTKANDIPISKLPADVKAVLDQYIKILSSSADLDACEKSCTEIFGGGLVNESAENITLRNNVKPYSLKKDFNSIKFYQVPVKITRVNASPNNGQYGFGASAITGKSYKIWIAKKDGAGGMPAPVTIVVPEGHATIKTPKVVTIGSF